MPRLMPRFAPRPKMRLSRKNVCESAAIPVPYECTAQADATPDAMLSNSMLQSVMFEVAMLVPSHNVVRNRGAVPPILSVQRLIFVYSPIFTRYVFDVSPVRRIVVTERSAETVDTWFGMLSASDSENVSGPT